MSEWGNPADLSAALSQGRAYTQGSKTFQYLEENKTMSVRSTDRGTRRSDAEGRGIRHSNDGFSVIQR